MDVSDKSDLYDLHSLPEGSQDYCDSFSFTHCHNDQGQNCSPLLMMNDKQFVLEEELSYKVFPDRKTSKLVEHLLLSSFLQVYFDPKMPIHGKLSDL